MRRSEIPVVHVGVLVGNPVGGWALLILRQTDQGHEGRLVPLYPARDAMFDALWNAVQVTQNGLKVFLAHL